MSTYFMRLLCCTYKVVVRVTLECVDETLVGDHLDENYQS